MPAAHFHHRWHMTNLPFESFVILCHCVSFQLVYVAFKFQTHKMLPHLLDDKMLPQIYFFIVNYVLWSVEFFVDLLRFGLWMRSIFSSIFAVWIFANFFGLFHELNLVFFGESKLHSYILDSSKRYHFSTSHAKNIVKIKVHDKLKCDHDSMTHTSTNIDSEKCAKPVIVWLSIFGR